MCYLCGMKAYEKTIKEIPSDVIWATYIINFVKYVGEDVYNKVEDVIKKYPEYFPWETKYNNVPKEVHEAYIKEKYPYKDKPITCTGGILSQMREAEVKDYIDYSKKSLEEVWEDFIRLEEDVRLKEKERYNKDRTLWDKHYKKYNLEYRE